MMPRLLGYVALLLITMACSSKANLGRDRLGTGGANSGGTSGGGAGGLSTGGNGFAAAGNYVGFSDSATGPGDSTADAGSSTTTLVLGGDGGVGGGVVSLACTPGAITVSGAPSNVQCAVTLQDGTPVSNVVWTTD